MVAAKQNGISKEIQKTYCDYCRPYCFEYCVWLRPSIYFNQSIMVIGMKKNVLVLCTGNSCRSQMAHGYLQHFYGNEMDVYSAGIETHGVNPRAIAIMKEDDIDISNHTSNNVNEYLEIPFDFILTVCDHAAENCPYIPGNAIRIHHSFSDPSKLHGTEDEIHQAFEKTRNEIKEYCANLKDKINA
ncbi:MAG: hypothetical protein RLZZ94_1773 [Bacteroidota bacterium]